MKTETILSRTISAPWLSGSLTQHFVRLTAAQATGLLLSLGINAKLPKHGRELCLVGSVSPHGVVWLSREDKQFEVRGSRAALRALGFTATLSDAWVNALRNLRRCEVHHTVLHQNLGPSPSEEQRAAVSRAWDNLQEAKRIEAEAWAKEEA